MTTLDVLRVSQQSIKILSLGFMLWLAATPLIAQENPEEQALVQAQRMAALFNNRNFTKYATFIAPGEYGGTDAGKEKFVASLKEHVPGGAEIENIDRVAFKTFEASQQVLFLVNYNHQYHFIAGISEDGEQWRFTQPLHQSTHFEIIQHLIPAFDTSFAALIDPGFRKRTPFVVGKPLPPFTLVDLKGDSIASAQLAGKRIVLNFWQPACESCVREIPALNELAKAAGEKTIFLAPAIYTSKESLQTSTATHAFLYRVGALRNFERFSVHFLPTVIVADEHHTVVLKLEGNDATDLEKIKAALH